MKRRSLLVLLVLIIALVAVYASRKSNPQKDELEKITVQAGWLYNGEFANVCQAVTKGYYADEGLDVTLKPGGPSGAAFIVATTAVAQDSTITAGIDGDLVPLLRGITQSNPQERYQVKAFAAFWNENPYGFMVKDGSALKSIKDFGKKKPDGSKYKIGLTADAVVQNAIAKYLGISVNDLEIVTVGFDATPLLTGQVDALAGYWTTQAYELEKAGVPYRFISTSEMPGWDQPSMIAVASDNMLKNNSATLEKWLRATIKGTEAVIANPHQAAVDIASPACGGSAFDVAQEEWLINKALPLYDKSRIGWLSEEKISGFAKAYADLGQIPRQPELTEYADYSILNRIYSN